MAVFGGVMLIRHVTNDSLVVYIVYKMSSVVSIPFGGFSGLVLGHASVLLEVRSS